MSTTLELKIRIRALEARVAALETALNPEVLRQLIDSYLLACKPLDQHKLAENKARIEANRKLCPHCGIKPNHFFHVKNCPEKNKNNGANEEANR